MNTHLIAPDHHLHRDRLFTAPRSSTVLTLRFVVFVSLAAATLAWLLASVARLPENAVVLTVMTVAFLASWSLTNQRRATTHRVTVIRARVRSN